ncbi:MAG: hypothetical protein KAS46_03950 [Candidatus Aureabacteria bacterium]|nr:hypothetical protein [Candidatus Auribacterota bacterium]
MERHKEELIHERFIPAEIKTLDSKNRINLGEKILKLISGEKKADVYQVFVGEKGDILLRPAVTVPSCEAWIYRNPIVLKKIRQGLSEAKRGKVEKAEDINTFLGKI